MGDDVDVSGDRRQSPEFITSVPIRKTRAGLQFTCAAASHNQQDVWVCNSDGYVGQVCILTLNPEPAVTSCNGVCNARILSVTSVPVSRSMLVFVCVMITAINGASFSMHLFGRLMDLKSLKFAFYQFFDFVKIFACFFFSRFLIFWWKHCNGKWHKNFFLGNFSRDIEKENILGQFFRRKWGEKNLSGQFFGRSKKKNFFYRPIFRKNGREKKFWATFREERRKGILFYFFKSAKMAIYAILRLHPIQCANLHHEIGILGISIWSATPIATY